MTSSILGKGTESSSKDVFVEKIDFMGASLSINAGGAFASSISRFFPTVLEMMADGALNPLFSQDEFEKEKASKYWSFANREVCIHSSHGDPAHAKIPDF